MPPQTLGKDESKSSTSISSAASTYAIASDSLTVRMQTEASAKARFRSLSVARLVYITYPTLVRIRELDGSFSVRKWRKTASRALLKATVRGENSILIHLT